MKKPDWLESWLWYLAFCASVSIMVLGAWALYWGWNESPWPPPPAPALVTCQIKHTYSPADSTVLVLVECPRGALEPDR